MPRPRKQILLTQDLKQIKSPHPSPGKVEPLTAVVKGGISVPVPSVSVATPVPKQKPAEKPDAPTASEIMEKLKFSPVEELIQLYKNGKQTVIAKDGTALEIDLDASLKIKILSELASYNHSKAKPVDMGGSTERSVNVQIVMFPQNPA